MDQFGVLVERYGFKPRGNSAPLAQLKSNNGNANADPNGKNGFPQNIGGIPPMPDDFGVGDLDDIFNTQNKSATSVSTTHVPNILDGSNYGDLFGGVSSTSNPTPQEEGILGPESLFPFTKHNNASNAAADDLISGFGISEVRSDVKVSQPSSSHDDDPFLVFEPPAWLQPNTGNVPVQNLIDDELERLGRATKIKKEETGNKNNMDIGMGTPITSISKPISQKKEPVFGRSFPGGQKPASSTYVPKDFISLFEDDVTASGAFTERDGESDEQRRRRLNSHARTQDRMAQALAEKQQRDLRIHQEQEERSRLAGTLDNKIKRWASGKEGNLRALLSSLQDVLWAESGWQAASLTEMMESKSVKKVYYRATLYLHPDKVQQKGFRPQEKYIAEKVFHVLKEAYKVFEAQELR